MTGLGWLVDFLTSKVVTWVVGLYRDKVITDLQLQYDKYISDLLHTYDLDDIMEGKLLK
jgi:endo-1,4-beta-mannosidase